MPQCEKCGNQYDKAFEVVMSGKTHVFDSFECAVNTLAPLCAECGNRIMGHGLEAKGVMYCSAHCAKRKGIKGLEDRI